MSVSLSIPWFLTKFNQCQNNLTTGSFIIVKHNIGNNIMSTQTKVNESLLYAARDNNISDVELLLSVGANIDTVNPAGASPLILASIFGHTKIAQVLIDKGADINIIDTFGDTALMIASRKGHTELVELLESKDSKGKVRSEIQKLEASIEELRKELF